MCIPGERFWDRASRDQRKRIEPHARFARGTDECVRPYTGAAGQTRAAAPMNFNLAVISFSAQEIDGMWD